MRISDRFPFVNSITFRIPLIILLVLSSGIGITITYYSISQNAAIIGAKESEIRQEAEILYTAIKNNMLAGEAPIAVDLFRDFTRANFASEIRLYRADGVSAFSDNSTVRRVNKIIDKDKFTLKKKMLPAESDKTSMMARSVKMVQDEFISDTGSVSKRLVIYKPLINQPKCAGCHGLDHVVRGVIRISAPVDEVYAQARKNIIFSVVNFGIVVLMLTGAIIFFLRNFIIKKILRIGRVVSGVGEGDFKTKISVDSKDEIGELAGRINAMIDGLNEGFKLERFVSKSTLDHVKGDGDIVLGGEKKRLTVLFSDIRGFTSFSEKNEPEFVLATLNKIMNAQALIIKEFGGDIDKFAGDELMAVFEGDGMEIRAAMAAEKIREELKILNKTDGTEIFVGIGINTGEMISGNMGSLDRIDRTVIGDAVNIGARLCSAAGRNTIILSEAAYIAVEDLVDAAEHPPIKVKGKELPLKIYTLRRTL